MTAATAEALEQLIHLRQEHGSLTPADVAEAVLTHDLDEAIYLSDLVVIMGRRPGRIKEVLEVDLPRPRYEYDVRAEKEFARLRNIAWRSIKEEL